jgi:hypothetical protein
LPDAFAWDARIFHDFSGFTDWFFWVCWVDELRVTFFLLYWVDLLLDSFFRGLWWIDFLPG